MEGYEVQMIHLYADNAITLPIHLHLFCRLRR